MEGGLGGGLGGSDDLEFAFEGGVCGREVGKNPESWRSRDKVVTEEGGGELNILT